MGRRTKYTQEIAQTIVDGLSRGSPLAVICRQIQVDESTVYDWKNANEDFSQRFARGREIGFDAIAAETLAIADDGTNDYAPVGDEGAVAYNAEHVQRSKLRVETRLKLLAKWDPKRYGDKQQVEHSGQIGLAEMVLASMREREKK